jgi:predicted metal-dependent HD superfamily phosphohydrolase
MDQANQGTLVSISTATRFQQLCHRLGSHGEALMAYRCLVEAYTQPHRVYHTITHLEDCLQQFDRSTTEACNPDEVEAALWFHDVIYDPKAADNEMRSATWAMRTLQDLGVHSEVVDRVAAMVLLTQHNQEPDQPDDAILLDIDLSILGQHPDVFALYERGIRAEYSWVPRTQYCTKRVAILEHFLNRPTIYHTQFFRNQLEVRARENLARSIKRLRERLT